MLKCSKLSNRSQEACCKNFGFFRDQVPKQLKRSSKYAKLLVFNPESSHNEGDNMTVAQSRKGIVLKYIK